MNVCKYLRRTIVADVISRSSTESESTPDEDRVSRNNLRCGNTDGVSRNTSVYMEQIPLKSVYFYIITNKTIRM